MAKIGIFYGSATGTTADIARRLGNALVVADADIHDVATTAPHVLGQYDLILTGSSTHGDGRMEDDWYDFVDGAQSLDLSGASGRHLRLRRRDDDRLVLRRRGRALRAFPPRGWPS